MIRGLTLVAIVLGAVAFWANVFGNARRLIAEHPRDARMTAEQRLALPGRKWGAREDVLAWAARALPTDAHVFLDCPQPSSCSNALANWISYRLTPRTFTDYPTQAQWVLFYETAPGTLLASPGGPPVRVLRLMRYGPLFGIGELVP